MRTEDLPESVQQAVGSLFEALPLEWAMPDLLPKNPNWSHHAKAAKAVLELNEHPDLAALVWLYVDDLAASHEISQTILTPTGSFLHGIMHRREGDFWNSKYWLRQATGITLNIPEYDPSRFVDQVEQAAGSNNPTLVHLQRQEWSRLFLQRAGEIT